MPDQELPPCIDLPIDRCAFLDAFKVIPGTIAGDDYEFRVNDKAARLLFDMPGEAYRMGVSSVEDYVAVITNPHNDPRILGLPIRRIDPDPNSDEPMAAIVRVVNAGCAGVIEIEQLFHLVTNKD